MANVEVKQVDVMGLMGALRTNGKAKLSDFATPVESDNNSNNSKSATMEKNLKAADLIGKVIVIGGTSAKYIVKSIDGDKLSCDFVNDGKTMPMSVSVKQAEKFINDGKWTVSDNEDATVVGGVVVCVNEHHDITTDADVAEVDDIVPVVKPKAKPKSEEPAAEVKPIKPTAKPKKKPTAKTKKEPNPDATGTVAAKYVYATYTTSKGKTGAKITGLSESDAAYQQAAELHASGSYTKDKDGNKQFFLCFGPRYAAAAKDVCKAMNDGKSFEDCKAIIDKATEERAAKREEWKQKRSEPADDKEQEMFQLFKKFMAGDKDAMKKVGAMVKAA